jgi:hypothetical protein
MSIGPKRSTMSAARSTSGSLSAFTVRTWLPRSTAVEYLVLCSWLSVPKISLKKFLMLVPMPGSSSVLSEPTEELIEPGALPPVADIEPPGRLSSPCDRRTSELEKPDDSSSFLALMASL